ncbi:hypothetical protein AMR74_16080 [Halorubrum tropicale]|uniref:Uncharacterized protein n=1 Tax=Halorubrum tropicale TaxID=1765655 RepID=A0A0N0BPP1_9EURY|nr:hypothetical protein AMR74_16080 [Halorubrum tropicale]
MVFKQGSDTYHYLGADGTPMCENHRARRDSEDLPLIPTEEPAVDDFMTPCEMCQILQEHGGKTRSELVAAVKQRLKTGTDTEAFSKDELEEIVARLGGQGEGAKTGGRSSAGDESESNTVPGADTSDE